MELFPHQSAVLAQTSGRSRCAYYLDMGLGKTFVGSEKVAAIGHCVNLVICQKSKVGDWVQHFKDYYPESLVLDLTNKHELEMFSVEMSMSCAKFMVGIINYELAWRRPVLKELAGFTLMLDESSLISNEKAKRSKFILALKPAAVVLLSGTPVAGKYEQLWSQCRLLGWRIDKTTFYRSYVEYHMEDFGGFKHMVIDGYKNVGHLKNRLAEYGCVFMKSAEVLDLPEKIEQRIFVPADKKYKAFRKSSYLMLDDGTELVGDNSLTKILYERQLCGHYSPDKREAFRNLLQSSCDRFIVFYNFTAEYEVLRAIAEEEGRPVSVVNGKTKDLQAYSSCGDSVTFVQYRAGAMGLNLQLANRIIYFTLPLGKGSCDLWEQSKKRIHRIGQDRTCFYYYPLVKGSIEEWNLSLLQEGKELTDDLFKEGSR